jgi:hypothetical protein
MAAMSASAPALAIGDGARAYMLVPEGTSLLAANGIFIDGNASLDPATAVRNADLSVDVVALQFTQSIRTGSSASGLFAIVPVGQVDGNLTVDRPLRPPLDVSGKSSGLGDVQFGGVFGLVGSPSLDIPAYLRHTPGFALGALVKATAPTGRYDGSKAVNLGANRWALQVGAPLGYVVGASMLDPRLTTFELLPSVTFFSANDDLLGAEKKSQAALFRLEGHVTHNLNQAVWIGVDALYTSGGSTTTDGRDDDNSQSSLEMGATVGVNLSKNFALKATYGEVVSRNDSGLDGRGFRLVATVLF